MHASTWACMSWSTYLRACMHATTMSCRRAYGYNRAFILGPDRGPRLAKGTRSVHVMCDERQREGAMQR